MRLRPRIFWLSLAFAPDCLAQIHIYTPPPVARPPVVTPLPVPKAPAVNTSKPAPTTPGTANSKSATTSPRARPADSIAGSAEGGSGTIGAIPPGYSCGLTQVSSSGLKCVYLVPSASAPTSTVTTTANPSPIRTVPRTEGGSSNVTVNKSGTTTVREVSNTVPSAVNFNQSTAAAQTAAQMADSLDRMESINFGTRLALQMAASLDDQISTSQAAPVDWNPPAQTQSATQSMAAAMDAFDKTAAASGGSSGACGSQLQAVQQSGGMSQQALQDYASCLRQQAGVSPPPPPAAAPPPSYNVTFYGNGTSTVQTIPVPTTQPATITYGPNGVTTATYDPPGPSPATVTFTQTPRAAAEDMSKALDKILPPPHE